MTASKPRASVVARVGPRATVVDVEAGPRLALDAEGRWTALSIDGDRLRRTVDGAVLRVAGGVLSPLADDQLDGVHTRAAALATALFAQISGLQASELALIGERSALLDRLGAAARTSPADYAAQRKRFGRAYPEPVPILPPHRYRDVVVLPATGCPNHSCTFCDFYRDRPFRPLDDATFEQHLQEVVRLFGRALSQRGGVFLGSGSALSVSDRILLRRFARIREVMGDMARGVAAFHNPDLGKPRTVPQWRALREAGLVDVTVGLETGSSALRRSIHKSADMDRFVAAVADIKAAGIDVAVTILLGLGAPSDAAQHRQATADVVAQMPLTRRDRVYLSPLSDALSRTEARAEMRRFRAALRTDAIVGAYLVERFAYFA